MPVNSAEIKLFTEFERRAAVNPPKPLEEQTIEDLRAMTAAYLEFTGQPADISYKDDFMLTRDQHQIPIRIYNDTLSETTPVLIMYPGCGYVSDLFIPNAIACSRIAKYAGIKVIIMNFRLAPEHPLPTAIYDAYDVTKYVANHAKELQINPNKLFIGGLSSGAHCAAVIANLARNDSQLNIYHQILVNGVYDLNQTQHGYDTYEREDKMCTRDLTPYVFKHYGITTAEYSQPLFSPYYEPDLTHLPDTTFIIGEYDGLRNDSEAYYKKVKAAGNHVEKIILPGQTHNTLILRAAMSDGEDPAKIIANVIKAH